MKEIKLQFIDTNIEVPEYIKEYFHIQKNMKIFLDTTKPKENNIILDILLTKEKNKDLEIRITKILHKLGIPSHIKGYLYLKEGILFLCNNPNGKITKNIYPKIAKKHKTTVKNVEKDMRTAIEKGLINGDYEYINKIFSSSININKGKPTNLEFLKTISEKIS